MSKTELRFLAALLDLLKQLDVRASRVSLLQRVGQKVLVVVEKHKRNQLAFFDQVRFQLLKWWGNAAEFKGLRGLAQHATNALTFPVTSIVAEVSFRILKGLLTPERRYMDSNNQIGYLLCMINGDVTRRIPQWARE